MLIVMYFFHMQIFSVEDIRGYFHMCGLTSNSYTLCTKNDAAGKNCKCYKVVDLKKGGSCHKEWISMENGHFVTEHHSYTQ